MTSEFHLGRIVPCIRIMTHDLKPIDIPSISNQNLVCPIEIPSIFQ